MLKMNEAVFTPEGPQPLIREILPPEPFPVPALGPLQEAAEAVAGETQAPVAIAAASTLAVASLGVQGHADVMTLGGDSPTSLYLLTIAKSGERKTAVDKQLICGLREVEEANAEAYRHEFAQWVTEKKIHEGRVKAAQKLLESRDGGKRLEGEADLRAIGPEPAAPILPYRTVSEPTLEGMFRSFLHGQPAQGIFSDEAGNFLAGHAMTTDNRTKTLAGLNSLWNGSPIDRTRAADGCFRLYGRRLAVHLMAQPAVAHAFFADGLAADTGFLARCLICEPETTIGDRPSYKAKLNRAPVEAFASRLKAILAEPLPLAEDGRSLKPRLLRLSVQARVVLTQFADEVEAESGRGRAFVHITGTAAKAAEQAARIAGVLTLWGDLRAETVEMAAMIHGIELARFYLSEASRLSAAATISAEVAAAEKLRRWLLADWPSTKLAQAQPSDIAKTEIMNGGPGKRDVVSVEAACAMLERYGWLIPNPEGFMLRGKPRQHSWRIVRG